MLELHCHTTFSDGTLSPTELVTVAAAAGVKALAITDHDTVAGWEEARRTARSLGRSPDGSAVLEIVPGIELSTTHRGRSLHLLGFYPDPVRLAPILEHHLQYSRQRAEEILEKLAMLGFQLDLSDQPSAKAPGRTQIAAAMVQAGYVPSVREAFDTFLAEGQPAYVPRQKLLAHEGLQILKDCGAVSSWAHPFLFKGGSPEEVLPELVEAGLMGIEVYHPGHRPEQIQALITLGDRYHLVLTGGSDYHGPQFDARGKHSPVLNTFHLPLQLLELIQQRAEQMKR